MWEKILNLFFPTYCVSCGKIGVYFCENCFRALKPYPSNRCFYCKRRSAFGFTHPACRRKSSLDGVFSLFYYDEKMQKLVKAAKYRGAYRVLEYFLENLPKESLEKAREYFSLLKGAVLSPIPLHKNRFLQRGFNQAEIIARYFVNLFGLEMQQVLWRKKDNPPQAFLKKKSERFKNVRGIFGVRGGVEVPERIILVDDLITTGKTLEAAVLPLRKRGAKQVFAFTLAKG